MFNEHFPIVRVCVYVTSYETLSGKIVKAISNFIFIINYSHIGDENASAVLTINRVAGSEEWVIGIFSITGSSKAIQSTSSIIMCFHEIHTTSKWIAKECIGGVFP